MSRYLQRALQPHLLPHHTLLTNAHCGKFYFGLPALLIVFYEPDPVKKVNITACELCNGRGTHSIITDGPKEGRERGSLMIQGHYY